MKQVEWAAGFLPQNGSKAMGIGWQEERAATLRVADMGAVLIRNSERSDEELSPLNQKDALMADGLSNRLEEDDKEKVWTSTKGSFLTEWIQESVQTLLASDYKDPPVVMTTRHVD